MRLSRVPDRKIMAWRTGVLVLICVCGVTGCASRGVALPRADRGTSTNAPVVDPQSQSLVQPFSLDSGANYFTPPTSSHPHVSAAEALQAFTSTHLYAGELRGISPTVFLCDLTSFEGSSSVSASHMVPNIDGELIWTVFYPNVRVLPLGGAPAAASPRSPAPTPSSEWTREDIVVPVDADNGMPLDVEATTIDTDTISDGPSIQPPKPSAS